MSKKCVGEAEVSKIQGTAGEEEEKRGGKGQIKQKTVHKSL